MANLWIMTIGFVICLGLAGGTLFLLLRTVLNREDSIRIDLQDSPKDE
ncbi:hypothetical protein HHO41_06040 [Bacillus sp. DNRA2]|nr:hypothetical protein [Bacillus sp. DNRA2]NMD69841.1 hypothetical protein [Bacillus sp. DNRA2]